MIFNYFDPWRTTTLTCHSCGWQGTFEEAALDVFEEVFTASCPKCLEGKELAIVSHPSLAEAEARWDQLDDAEKARWTGVKQRYEDFQRAKLKSPDQIPDLDWPVLHLIWDMEKGPGGERVTVIRHANKVLWREPALWEGEHRFEAIVEILIGKYGSRLRDLAPTDASWLYLHGDDVGSVDRIEKLRERLRAGPPRNRSGGRGRRGRRRSGQ